MNQRKLPWRETKDPYRIWISEIILQQTRVNQGLPYYYEFIKQFPDIKSLATAASDEVMNVWQGLGYYTRARKMQEAAKLIYDQYHGKLPDNFSSLLKIPGIGPYTAAAIASFAYKEPVPVVDGNVIRVLARMFGIDADPASSNGKRLFHQKAEELIDKDQPDTFNQSVMEFGATLCMPRTPLCGSCPLRASCYAFNHNKVESLPFKKTSKTARKRYFHYLIFLSNSQVIIRRREEKDIWRSLYEFPLIETYRAVAPERLISLPEFQMFFGKDLPGQIGKEDIIPGSSDRSGEEQLRQEGLIPKQISRSKKDLSRQESLIPKQISRSKKGLSRQESLISKTFKHSALFKHILSHQQIMARFYLIPVYNDTVLDSTGFIQVDPEDIRNYPVPRLIDKFLAGDTWSSWRSSYC